MLENDKCGALHLLRMYTQHAWWFLQTATENYRFEHMTQLTLHDITLWRQHNTQASVSLWTTIQGSMIGCIVSASSWVSSCAVINIRTAVIRTHQRHLLCYIQ